MQDPTRRTIALAFYKQGYSHADVAPLLELTKQTIERECELDPDWHDQVQDAMLNPFEPVLAKAIELAKQADALGIHEGSLKAMTLVMNFYTKNLDREHAEKLLDRKGEIAKEIAANTQPPVTQNLVLSSPDQIAALYAAAADEEQKAGAIEVEHERTD